MSFLISYYKEGFSKIRASIIRTKTAEIKGIQRDTAGSAQASFIIPTIH